MNLKLLKVVSIQWGVKLIPLSLKYFWMVSGPIIPVWQPGPLASQGPYRERGGVNTRTTFPNCLRPKDTSCKTSKSFNYGTCVKYCCLASYILLGSCEFQIYSFDTLVKIWQVAKTMCMIRYGITKIRCGIIIYETYKRVGLSDAWVGFLGYFYKSTKKSWQGSDPPPPFLAMPRFSLGHWNLVKILKFLSKVW